MESIEGRLRDEFGQAWLPLDADQMLETVARRRRRRRAATAVAVAVLVVLGTGTALRVVDRGASVGPAGPTPTDTPSPARELTSGPRLVQLRFAGDGHGFALLSNCAPSVVGSPCQVKVAATMDAGATWAVRPLPDGAGRDAALAEGTLRLFVLGGDRVVVGWLPTTVGSDTGPDLVGAGGRWYSDNGGRTWQWRERSPNGTVRTVPADAQLYFDIADGTPIVLRVDGTAATLSPGPGGQYGDAHASNGTDGSIWVSALSTDLTQDKKPYTVVSHDRGATWQPFNVPTAGWPWHVVTVDGKNVFQVTYGDRGELRVYRSSDAGHNWNGLSLPPTGKGCHDNLFNPWSGAPPAAVAAAAAVADGRLILCTGEDVYRLDPNTGAFERVAGVPRLVGLASAGPFAVGIVARVDGFRYRVTADGQSWQELTF